MSARLARSLSGLALVCAACSGTPTQTPAPTPAPEPDSPSADLVFLGGRLHTMDTSRPQAAALAIRGRRILAVGDDSDIERFIGPDTRVVRLEGRSVTPGLSDAHCHLYGLGTALENVDLGGARTALEAARRVADAAAARPGDLWITGRGWDQNLWPDKQYPDAALLDRVIADRPVALRRIDGHALWANSEAMKRVGIDAHTADPPGGRIVRHADGRPTGVFIDTAMALIEIHMPAPDEATIERRILAASERALAAGITTVHEMGISDRVAGVYRRLAAEGRLPIRVYAFLSGDMHVIATIDRRPPDTDDTGEAMFVMRAVKLYADGAMGSRGAALLEPYADEPENRGLWITPPDNLERAAMLAAGAGWQLGVHAIGDAGNRAVLDAFAAARAAHPGRDLRFRVEHAQILSPDDVPRFAALGVIASMQPTHATSDMPWAEARVGRERIQHAYAWRAIIDSGAHLAGGSDFPVEGVSPLWGIYAAVTRQDHQGQPAGGWYPGQRMTLDEALAAFTREAAYAAFAESARGRLQPGQIADITVYDRALAADASLLDTRIDWTIVNGRVRYQRVLDD